MRGKADDLDAAGLQTRVGAAGLTLGRLLKHLAAVKDYTFTTKLPGKRIGAPWDATVLDGGDWEFTSAANDAPEQLDALWEGAVDRSRGGLTRTWPTADSTSSSASPGPMAAAPACAGSSVT